MPYFVYVIKPSRENFIDTITEEESAIVGEHFDYLKDLLDRKILYLAGRTAGAEFGIGIFDCDSEEVFKSIAEKDPAVVKKVFTAEYYPFSLALYRNLV